MNKYSAERISKLIEIHRNTWINWKKNKPKLVYYVLKGIECDETENGGITINGNNNIVGHHNKIMINGNDICAEICELLEKLPEQKQKKFFYKIMAELYEEIEK